MGMRGLSPGVSTERQVREAFGEPAMDLKEADGGRVLAYTTGPMGTQTWIARLGKDATLVSLEQVLDEEHMRRISPGTTTGEEVLRLIGPPWRKVDFPNKRQVAWDYMYADSWAYRVNYSVMLDEKGVVAETVNVRIEGGKNGRD
jgi:outer membrane protein assembly factor BamE (lipoprotein component of BamABCDE complex)